LTRRAFVAGLLALLVAGAVLRTLWLRADPPTTGAGIVWHDEGAWVHNARNQALWGVWRTDEWNPVFIAPVFTALEYASFATLGVGTWQARMVPVLSGLAAVLLLVAGLHSVAGRGAALVGGVLLSTNYIFVMWNRAALLESTMTALLVAAWAAYAAAERRPIWGAAAGAAAVLAWFTKGAAAFFLAAIAFDAVVTLVRRRATARTTAPPGPTGDRSGAALWTLAGLVVTAAIVILAFVAPHWSEYRFYNWQMTVARKPTYTLDAFMQRASWLPIVQGIFSRMWLVVAAGAIALVSVVAGWRTARPAERLLVLWVLLGLLELVVHDSGNERRYVMFIPPLVALGALLVGSGRTLMPAAAAHRSVRWLTLPVVLLLGYVVFGSLVRLAFLDEIAAGNFRSTARISAGVAALVAAWLVWKWPVVMGGLSRRHVPASAAVGLVGVALAWNLVEYGQWAAQARELNYQASVDVGGRVSPGGLVHGKLANGLSLENRIRPIFIGTGFGNYADRLHRDDVRYILTYTLPRVGYESGHEGRLIQELLDRYPGRREVASFEVDETPAVDRATLFDKFPDRARD